MKRLLPGLAFLAIAIILLNLHNAGKGGVPVYWLGAVCAVVGVGGLLSYFRGRRRRK